MESTGFGLLRRIKWIWFLLSGMLFGCHSSHTVSSEGNNGSGAERIILFSPGPQALVYKTVRDYSRQVPVLLNAAKTEIVSYPDPRDLQYRGNLATPTPLDNGYWLDNRGIGVNVAFLNYTYEEYARLPEAPARSVLLECIIDRNPLSELWNCGLRSQYRDEVRELNELAGKGFPGCRKLY